MPALFTLGLTYGWYLLVRRCEYLSSHCSLGAEFLWPCVIYPRIGWKEILPKKTIVHGIKTIYLLVQRNIIVSTTWINPSSLQSTEIDTKKNMKKKHAKPAFLHHVPEIHRFPSFSSRIASVGAMGGIIAVSYEARAKGVTRQMSGHEAKKAPQGLVNVLVWGFVSHH